MFGLYVHIPFCKSKCPYCNFNSIAGTRLVSAYLDALRKEAVWRGKRVRDKKFETLYVGGGTPSVLDERQLSSILACLQNAFRFSSPSPLPMDVRSVLSLRGGRKADEVLHTDWRIRRAVWRTIPSEIASLTSSPMLSCESKIWGTSFARNDNNQLTLNTHPPKGKGRDEGDGGEIESTLEVNPETVTEESAQSWFRMGFNRISMGVQSFQDRFLRTLGRIHDAKQARRAFRTLRKAGFLNVSVDLIYGIPKQTLKDWKNDLREAIRLQPDHISLYGLTIEEGSKWHERSNFPTFKPSNPNNDLGADMYNFARQFLKQEGFEHYEISSFAHPGMRSQHNQLYWKSEEYIGLGAGAHSYLDGRRLANPRDVGEYINVVGAGLVPARVPGTFATFATNGHPQGVPLQFFHEHAEILSASARFREALVLGLRLVSDGVDLEDLERRFGMNCPADLEADLIRLSHAGAVREPPLLSFDPPHVRLTDRGVLFADRVAVELI